MDHDKDQKDITKILSNLATGNREAVDRLFPLLYDELREVAMRHLCGERKHDTLQPTALVNEVYLKMIKQRTIHFQNRRHFLALSALMMRRLIVDHARSRHRKKRGDGAVTIELTDELVTNQFDLDQVLDFEDALTKLEQLDERQARIVELRFFSGLSIPEIADILEVSQRTVEGEWHMARAWLKRELIGWRA